MGKFDYFSYGYVWYENGERKTSKKYSDIPDDRTSWIRKVDYESTNELPYGKYFWFAYMTDDRWDFEQFKSISKGKLIKCIDNKCSSEYANIFDRMECSCKYSPYDKSKDRFFNLSLDEFVQKAHLKFETVSIIMKLQRVAFLRKSGCRDVTRFFV